MHRFGGYTDDEFEFRFGSVIRPIAQALEAGTPLSIPGFGEVHTAAFPAPAPQLTSAPYSPATATPWTNAPAPSPAPVAHVTAPASAPVQPEERDRQIANDPRVKGREALAAELAAALPSASADVIAAKVASLGTKVVAPSLRHGRSPVASSPAAPPAPGKPNGLRLAVEAMVRRDAGLPTIPRESSAPKTGHQPTPGGEGGLRAAVDAMIEEDARRGRWSS